MDAFTKRTQMNHRAIVQALRDRLAEASHYDETPTTQREVAALDWLLAQVPAAPSMTSGPIANDGPDVPPRA